MKRFRKTHFAFLLILTVLLSGCARKTPVENIVDSHTQHIDEVLGYAYNNIEQTSEIKYLENELESCSIALNDVKEAYYSEMQGCESKISYWRLLALNMTILLAIAIWAKIKKVW